MSEIKVNSIVDASGGATATINGYTPTASNMGGKNRIINGDMRIDQRNAGASVTCPAGASYVTDRFVIQGSVASKFTGQQNAGSVTPPAGFTNYLGLTSSSAYTPSSSDFLMFQQWVEGLNTADLGWGTANAKAVTVSFWVRSSLTGTFVGSLNNSDYTRSYPFTFSIPSANTWTQITKTIAGDTSGTWLTTNGRGIGLHFNMGTGTTYQGTANAWNGGFYVSTSGVVDIVGTSGATFYITGVQLEAGSVATPFEHRQYGQELALCQRYCYVFSGVGVFSSMPFSGYISSSGSLARMLTSFPMVMRTSPSLTVPAASNVIVQAPTGVNYTPSAIVLTANSSQPQSALIDLTISGAPANSPAIMFDNNTSASKFIFTAEL